MSIQKLFSPENVPPSFESIPTVDEFFRQVNFEAENPERELEPRPIPPNSKALAAVSVILAHIKGTGTVAGLKIVSSLQDIFTYMIMKHFKCKLDFVSAR